MKMQTRGGEVIEILYTLHNEPGAAKEWHAVITGERLSCCGIEFTTFHKKDDEPDLTRGERCQACALVVFNIKLM